MYSNPSVAVDKGLGFDFGAIANFVSQAGKTALGVYQNQMQQKQMLALAQRNMYGGMQLPIAPTFAALPNMPQPIMQTPQQYRGSTGLDTTTMLLLGLAVLGGGYLLMSKKGSSPAPAAA